MKKIYQILFCFLLIGSLLSCSSGTDSDSVQAQDQGPFYVEFVSCTKGNEFSKSNLSNMISEWRSLPKSSDLRGSYLYDPIEEQNAFGPSMWWELEWSSKDSADKVWQDSSQDEAFAEWSEKYQDVISCNGEGRNAWDIVVPISSTFFGEANESGYFYSQYWTCSYKNDAGRKELEDFLPLHTAKVESSELQGTGYHYGVYFDRRSLDASHADVQANLVWGEWATSQETMEVQNQNFNDNFQDVFEEFDKIGSCLEEPDTFNSWVLYSSSEPDKGPQF